MADKNKKPVRRSPTKTETKIKIRGSDNAVATGPKSFAANVRIVFQDNWRPFAVILIIVAVLLIAVLYYVIPKKATQFHSQFNVAVARFLVVDGNSHSLSSRDGFNLAESIYQQIVTNFQEIQLDKVASNEVWGPDQTGVITNDDQARAFALATNATIVVYGQIVEAGVNSTFTPRFYVNDTSIKEAAEITGEHALGSQLDVNLRADMPLIQNPGLQARVNGLDMLTIGLAYYSIDDFQNALSYFQKADNAEWIGSGKETVYLLIGNAYIRQASKIQDFSTLPLADKAYQDALAVNPNYGRALIGEANVVYLNALNNNNCDPASFNNADNLLNQALALQDQPASANIETKVHFYRGQLSIIRDSCHIQVSDWLTIAQQEFTWVTNQYETRVQNKGDYQGIEMFASQAYARLGYVAYQRNNKDVAVSFIQKAILISSPFYKGEYTSLLGDIYAATGSKEQAVQEYQNAIAIAEANGDAQSVQKYQQKLQSVSSP